MNGLDGTLAYAAKQRTREIGLRIALSATPHQATAMLLRSGMTLAAVGIRRPGRFAGRRPGAVDAAVRAWGQRSGPL